MSIGDGRWILADVEDEIIFVDTCEEVLSTAESIVEQRTLATECK